MTSPEGTYAEQSKDADTLVIQALNGQEAFNTAIDEINSTKGRVYLFEVLGHTTENFMDTIRSMWKIITPINDGVKICINGKYNEGITDAYRSIINAFQEAYIAELG